MDGRGGVGWMKKTYGIGVGILGVGDRNQRRQVLISLNSANMYENDNFNINHIVLNLLE